MDFFDLVNEKHSAQEKFAKECEYDTNIMMREAINTTLQLAEKYKIAIKFGTPELPSEDSTNKILFENIK
jgi:hypothetical protein